METEVAAPSTVLVDAEARELFLKWTRSQPGIELCNDIDIFHEFKQAAKATRNLRPSEENGTIWVGYRGVVAKKDIPADTVLVRVHRSCCIGPDGEWRRKVSLAETDDSTEAQVASSHGLTNACLTVLRLLHEQGLGEASAFFAYLIVLPRDHRLPMEWNEAELELLKGTSAEPLVRMGSIDSQFEEFQRVITLNPALWKSSLCNETSLAKGVNWVRSRGFTVMGDPVMIPGADMFNHDPDLQSVQMETDGDEHFLMKTVHPVKAGDEIFSSFGHLSNAQLLNSYGFVLPGNPFDTVMIPRQLVVDTCRATFIKFKGDQLGNGNAEAEAAWEKQLGGAKVCDESSEVTSIFVISKYDLLPEDLADFVQALTLNLGEEAVYATMVAIALAKSGQYCGSCRTSHQLQEGIGGDARTLATMLVTEEKEILKSLRMQLMAEIVDGGESDESKDEGQDTQELSPPRQGFKRAKIAN